MQMISNKGIKGSDEIGNLMWAHTFTVCDVMQNAICPQLAYIHWDTIGTKQGIFDRSRAVA